MLTIFQFVAAMVETLVDIIWMSVLLMFSLWIAKYVHKWLFRPAFGDTWIVQLLDKIFSKTDKFNFFETIKERYFKPSFDKGLKNTIAEAESKNEEEEKEFNELFNKEVKTLKESEEVDDEKLTRLRDYLKQKFGAKAKEFQRYEKKRKQQEEDKLFDTLEAKNDREGLNDTEQKQYAQLIIKRANDNVWRRTETREILGWGFGLLGVLYVIVELLKAIF